MMETEPSKQVQAKIITTVVEELVQLPAELGKTVFIYLVFLFCSYCIISWFLLVLLLVFLVPSIWYFH